MALGGQRVGVVLEDPHLTAALIDRLTESSHVFNLKEGVTLRNPMTEAEDVIRLVVSLIDRQCQGGQIWSMNKLAEIEKAAETLPPKDKQELMLFLAARLRTEGARLPEPRALSREEMESWIAEDEADLQRFKQGA